MWRWAVWSSFAVILVAISLAGCDVCKADVGQKPTGEEEVVSTTAADDDASMAPDQKTDGVDEGEQAMRLSIDGTDVEVAWEDNESVGSLAELVGDGTLTVQMSRYGGFEQVGALGTSLTSKDVQTTTQPGDIVLYSSNQIVIFYGTNSWAYTRLGHIVDRTPDEMNELLGSGDVSITISAQ